MLSHRGIYYTLKPYVPWTLRMAVRRLAARRCRRANLASWPILPAAARAPADWPGWPEGRRFAFVLTHDVEGSAGVEKCARLADLEQAEGFRSSFNFIPDGGYRVPAALRRELAERGCEIGIHDLHHDGKLFSSRRGFSAKAIQINRYLREWGAVGFRAGFMLRNLDWYHELNVRYDASTFDTDPFEPMPDGAGTIFPFWIPCPPQRPPDHPGRHGYVELPYTLPQDSTLFLLLGETTPAIWRDKLDWIAAHGGMALVNVHPDYLRFPDEPVRPATYPSEHYRALLDHLRHRHAGQYWNPTPAQLAAWVARFRPAHADPATAARLLPPPPPAPSATMDSLKGKRAAVILYSNYPADPRPRRAAEAMVESGIAVDLLCLSQSDADPREETIAGVRVFRHPMRRARDSVWTYVLQYARFFVASFLFLTRRGLRQKYDFVHVHNMPDFLVLSTLLPKLQGARIILDLHDPSPELMVTIFHLSPRHWFIGTLRLIERLSIALADLVITPNLAFKNLFASRSCAAQKILIVMNSPEPRIFHDARPAAPVDAPPAAADAEFRVMHHGLIAHRHGVDLLVAAIAQLRATVPGLRLDLYGGKTAFLDVVLATAERLQVADLVRYHGAKTQEEIAAAIEQCHVGVVPNRRSVFTEINFPTRIFEYLAMHRPVVVPDTLGIRDYFGADDILFFTPDHVDDLAAKIQWVHDHPAASRHLAARGAEIYRRSLWPDEKRKFQAAIAAI